MVLVLPAVVLDALVDLFLAVAIVAASLLLFAFFRRWLNWSAAAVASLPIIGGMAQSGIVTLRDFLTSYMGSMEGVILSYVHNGARDLVAVLNAVVTPKLQLLQSWLDEHGSNIRWLNDFYEGTNLSGFWIAAVATIGAAEATASQAWASVSDLWPRAVETQTQVNRIWAQLGQAQADLAHLRDLVLPAMAADLARADAALVELSAYMPLVRGLQVWERQQEQALADLGRAETAVAARVGDLERYRALLALLSLLGALSASQVQELARTARCINVCERLGLLDDLDDRVEALENAGH